MMARTAEEPAAGFATLEGTVKDLTYWTSMPSKEIAKVEECDHFNARGMLCVYGRGDHFVRRTFNMAIWLKRDGRLLMRLWSRNLDTDGRSFGILGVDRSNIPAPHPPAGLVDYWVPKAVREAYDKWIMDEW